VIKGIVIGFILAIAISVGCVFLYFSSGMAPVATADPPCPLRRSSRIWLWTRILRSNTFLHLLCPRTNLVVLPVRAYTNSTVPCVTDSQGSHQLTM
jgi:hypothetical protein